MHNRPDSLRVLSGATTTASPASSVRLLVLFTGLVAVFLVIGIRIAWLQTTGRDRYVVLWDKTFERVEPIPARDGRILTADGQVLACDELTFTISVHYRWLEDPPDPLWLRSQALERLAPRARRSRDKRLAAEQEVLAIRNAMHRDLAEALQLSADSLQSRFRFVQQRVERIAAAVEARHKQNESSTTSDDDSTAEPGEAVPSRGWRGLWALIERELTTPPERPQRDPIIVQEELAYHEIATQVSLETVSRIESFPSRFNGVKIEIVTRREYPCGPLASHVVGARTPLRKEELAARREQFAGDDPLGYRAGDRLGRTGVELAADAVLHGVWGERRVVTNRQGEILKQEVIREPVHGRDVVLALDSRLQQSAEALLDALIDPATPPPDDQPPPQGGCVVAIDVRTGEILAAASAPRHDARWLISATQAEWQAAANDPRRPFFPRVTQAALPPGSVFKLLTAVAALESGAIAADERLECQGFFSRPDRERCALFTHAGIGHGPLTLSEALAESCNVFFYTAAQRMGPQPLIDWARRFGVGLPTGCDLSGEQAGRLPTPERTSGAREPWYPGTTRQLAIGQASLTMTPLQTARLIAAIANDGWLLSPRFVRRIEGPEEEPVERSSPSPIQLASFVSEARSAVRVRDLTPGTLAAVRLGMLQTVESDRGTGRAAALPDLRVAGKTGTAEVGGGQPDHAWFAGYAPAEAPRVAVVVVLEQGGGGGRMAAPVAREFLRKMADLKLLPVGRRGE